MLRIVWLVEYPLYQRSIEACAKSRWMFVRQNHVPASARVDPVRHDELLLAGANALPVHIEQTCDADDHATGLRFHIGFVAYFEMQA